MKRIFRKLTDLMFFIIGIIIPIKLLVYYNYARDRIFSAIVKKGFRKAGKVFRIDFPANILGKKYISIGDNFTSFSRLRLEAYDRHLGNTYYPSIEIGNNVSINFDCHIGCVNRIVIGNNVLLASKIFITDHMHGEISIEALKTPPSLRKLISKGPVIIEDNVWIGEGVAIMPNVTIGKNSIIGANSVVNKDVPANTVVAGVPAKIIKVLN